MVQRAKQSGGSVLRLEKLSLKSHFIFRYIALYPPGEKIRGHHLQADILVCPLRMFFLRFLQDSIGWLAFSEAGYYPSKDTTIYSGWFSSAGV